MLRQNFVPRSLSARVFWLIVASILMVEMLVVMPGLGRERQYWLWSRAQGAELLALSIRDGAGPPNPVLRNALLQLSDTQAITLTAGPDSVQVLPDKMPSQFGPDIYLQQESLLTSMWRANLAVLGRQAPYARVCETFRQGNMHLAVIISQRRLAHDLRHYLLHVAALAAVVGLVTASLVFVALDRELVQPMRVMTASIAGFRRNPGYAGLGGLKWLSARGDDEIAAAARELVAMQYELRAALWRNARLAALGTSVAKISHDLRNILTSALLVADRFERHDDPMVKQAANTLIPAMERAVELVSRTVDFAREGPPAVARAPVAPHALIEEVEDMLRATFGNVVIDDQVPRDLVLFIDRNQIYRVLVNLMRNAAEAGATRITITQELDSGMTLLVVADNGPGLPPKALPNLFRPFTGTGRNGGTGLGLAIARDLARAHGGDVFLRRTGPGGTEFGITLADEDTLEAPSEAVPLANPQPRARRKPAALQ
jgi:signal transduction histidine kinase